MTDELQQALAAARKNLGELEQKLRNNPDEQQAAIEAADVDRLVRLRAEADIWPGLIAKAKLSVQAAEREVIRAQIGPACDRVNELAKVREAAEFDLKAAQEKRDEADRNFQMAYHQARSLEYQLSQVGNR